MLQTAAGGGKSSEAQDTAEGLITFFIQCNLVREEVVSQLIPFRLGDITPGDGSDIQRGGIIVEVGAKGIQPL